MVWKKHRKIEHDLEGIVAMESDKFSDALCLLSDPVFYRLNLKGRFCYPCRYRASLKVPRCDRRQVGRLRTSFRI